MTAILGISAFYHDSAAALVIDGEVVAAAQEERFTRKKHDQAFPRHAIAYCLQHAGLTPADLELVAFYEKPLLKFERLLETYLAYAPSGLQSFRMALPVWLRQKLHLPREMAAAVPGYRRRFIFTEHHESHAASAFFPSPFEEAAILTLDGVGEWATAAYGSGRGNSITLARELRFPHSLGLLYSAFTYYCGFAVNSGEYKLMGLAPYGEPKYVALILQRLMDLKEDGSFRLDMSYFNYCQGLTMTSRKFEDLFGGRPRLPESRLTDRHMDIAASIQRVTEEVMLRAARHVHRQTGATRLCLAGGVALNCVGNGRILRDGPFEQIWIQPAAGDAGGALGAALLVWHQLLGNERRACQSDSQHGSLLGPSFSDAAICEYLDSVDAVYRQAPGDDNLCELIADRIAAGQVVGWFQGRMEFGPRALGTRSIVGDARNRHMQSTMNLKVKFRESFRPFAPAVLREEASTYFDVPGDEDSPHMLFVAPVKEERRRPMPSDAAAVHGFEKLAIERSDLPAITHVDYSARLQTVDPDRHGLYHRLLRTFREKTGCGVMVNTSFNLGWDPIVCTPRDAYETFMSSEIDTLAIGHAVVRKADQPAYVPESLSNDPAAVLAGLWCCPSGDAGELESDNGSVRCTRCGHRFALDEGVPRLFWPHEPTAGRGDVTEVVKAFYEAHPFPNYDGHDSVRALIETSRRRIYARQLNQALPFNSTVLEIGCGTGQLSNFLGVACRRVIGADLCLASLRLAEDFRRRHGLGRVRFVQMNLFRPAFRPGSFDAVLCDGVLHHTADSLGGFEQLVPLVRPGGHIVIGLYNRYGRFLNRMRRRIFQLTGGRGEWLDPYLRTTRLDEATRRAWFADRYLHPHESEHTLDEVLGWFERAGLEFVRGIPSTSPSREDLTGRTLFDPEPLGSRLDHVRLELKQALTGDRDGGVFVMIGRKPGAAVRRSSRTENTEVHAFNRAQPESIVA
jgi:carbamoyltransferase